MKNSLNVNTCELESKVMLAASPVTLAEFTSSAPQTADDLPESIVLPSETAEAFSIFPAAGESGGEDQFAIPEIFLDAEGQQVEIVPFDSSTIGPIDVATNEVPPFSATGAFDAVGEGNNPFIAGSTGLNLVGENTLEGVLNGFVTRGGFIQTNDTTLLLAGTEAGLDLPIGASPFGLGSSRTSRELPSGAVDEAVEAEIASELANAASENSRGGTTITPEERDTATIEGLAVAADSLASGLFIGQTGGEEDGSTLLTRVDPSEDANLLSSDDTSDDTSDDNDSRERAPRRTTIRTRQRRGAVTAGF